jgi:hypothetical protein
MILRLSVRNLSATGTVVYSETRPITTNLGGLFSVQIGSVGSTSSMGTIAGVNWLVGDKYLQVEIDPAANNNYINLGTVQLVSVPYAFATGNAGTVTTNANLTGVVTSVGNQTSIANGAITNDMIASVNKSKVGLDLVNNTSDASKPISSLTEAALDLKANASELTNLANAMGTKLNIADSTIGYITPSQLAAITFDQTPIRNAIDTKINIADSANGYVTPAQLAAKTFDTTSLSNRINLKASAANVAILTTNVASNTASITANTAEINLKASAANVAILTTNVASNTASITANTAEINLKASAADVAILTTNVASNTASITANTAEINLKASAANVAILTTNVASNTASITANTAEINLKAPIASPSFTGTVTTGEINTGVLSATSITTPVYASTPQVLTAGATINWNPALGLNASVTLDQNSTLSFTNTPNVGSYGTVVLTQDGTGSRTIAIPIIANVTNKVLGSTSTSTVTLSTAANSKDILNFYYDGTNCYWNIGQGYGATAASSSAASINLTTTGSGEATLSGTNLNIPNNSAGARLNSDQITATAGQTSFTLSQTPSNAKAWMFINGVRTNNNAYSVSGTTLTYTPANNNSYTIVVGDRIQFDYAY